jgi:HD-GYP domain-containing protein (c-di-GMP phosphodiesterase class II)
MGPEKALEEMERCAGIQFDPDLIKAFLKAQKEKMESSGSRKLRSSIPIPPRTWG